MPSPLFADRPAARPPERGTVDALISQTRRLRTEVDAVHRDTGHDDTDPHGRWYRALCELAMHQLDDLDGHFGQLRHGAAAYEEPVGQQSVPDPAAPHESLLSRVGSAEWNLLTDEVTWSPELYGILGRTPGSAPLPLDELSSVVCADDQAQLNAMVTDCLIEGRPIDGEFRINRPDGGPRTVHMMGEPVLDAHGGTASMWAVLRDVSELRRTQLTVRETRDSLQRRQHSAQSEHQLAVELQEAVLPPWQGSLQLPQDGAGALDLAAHYLPSSSATLIGGDWYDALELPDGESLLSVGDLTGHGVSVTSGMAMVLGALRGMAYSGVRPGPLLGWLNQMLDTAAQPALGSAVCCRYHPGKRTLSWAQAGHPAPMVFRDGVGRVLTPPAGVLLGAAPGSTYEQAEEQLEAGDLVLLHTDGLVPRHLHDGGVDRLLDLAPKFAEAGSAQDCVRAVVEEFGHRDRPDDACVLIARVGS
ncbi:Phosphoserine phosphatase RsbU [Streptomyces sp. YIM 130001]|uniref:PP2C family protein-serine/threonine phosphatase n=1 Tax=Streptomyces sp. YIM 130001 TaxID=2259644 RepID=UPI000E651298|nr:SpoIIE family protein phosphatase [Streptomyces sp. YIM 130001]RII14658.1 Phosphoserine phosphatase RsbU [Streptomyces sp. YIM 130001]